MVQGGADATTATRIFLSVGHGVVKHPTEQRPERVTSRRLRGTMYLVRYVCGSVGLPSLIA